MSTSTETADRREVLITFRCPAELVEAADKAAGRELLSRSAFARRALLVAVRDIEVNAEPMAAAR
jgi:hypothetical protein